MKSYVGTSGWAYKSWNPDGFEWYITQTGFNAIELNMSFYRYPRPENILKWRKMAPHLKWVIKVNQVITHRYRFSEACFPYFDNFKNLFRSMDKQIAFYLFQLPPWSKPQNLAVIEKFFKHCRLKSRFALEWRHQDWWTCANVDWAKSLGLTIVSVDAPDLPRDIINTNGLVYLRTHGRRQWYDHDYTTREIKEIANKIKAAKPKEAYIFFNNDNFMLKNGQKMMELLNIKPSFPEPG